MKIVLAIKPEYVTKIFNNEKKYEYRRKIPNKKISKILIYETYPTKKIVGEFIIEEILATNVNQLWEETSDFAGIDKINFFEYFKNNELCFAFKIKSVKKYKTPKKLNHYGINCHPQSFVYVD